MKLKLLTTALAAAALISVTPVFGQSGGSSSGGSSSSAGTSGGGNSDGGGRQGVGANATADKAGAPAAGNPTGSNTGTASGTTGSTVQGDRDRATSGTGARDNPSGVGSRMDAPRRASTSDTSTTRGVDTSRTDTARAPRADRN